MLFKNKFRDSDIRDTINKIFRGDIDIYSPIIKNNIENLKIIQRTSEELDEKQTEYVSDLAKIHLFMDKFKSNTKNSLLRNLFVEDLFAKYEYQKDNNLPYQNFEDLFNFRNFYNFCGISTWSGWFMIDGQISDDKGKNISFIPFFKQIAINTFEKSEANLLYSPELNHTETHETQHFVSGKGTYDGKYLFNGYLNSAQNNFNEICTEWNATKIVKEYLDDNLKSLKISKTFKDSDKTISFSSSYPNYSEALVFYDSLNKMSGDKLREIYYTNGLNIDSINNENIVNGMLDFSEKYSKIYDSVDKNKLIESNFDKMINSFSKLSQIYINEEIGLDHKPDATKKADAELLDKIDSFFETLESVNFIKEGDSYTQGELIRESILGAIYNKDFNLSSAKERLDNENSLFGEYVKDYYESQNTLGKSLYAKLKSAGKLPIISKDLNKDSSKDKTIDKENSKDKNIDTNLEL